MLKRHLCVAALAAAVIPLSAGGAENVRLSTLVPAGTSWHKALLEMGSAWNRDTGGRVTLTVFPGGQQGDEATAIKKMRTDVLQASFLSSVGLTDLDEAFNVFGMPFFLETPDMQHPDGVRAVLHRPVERDAVDQATVEEVLVADLYRREHARQRTRGQHRLDQIARVEPMFACLLDACRDAFERHSEFFEGLHG